MGNEEEEILEDDSDEDAETQSDPDEDEDDYGAYTVASKEDFVHVETKTKVKTKGGKNMTGEEVQTEVKSVENSTQDVTQSSNSASNGTPGTSTAAAPVEDVWSQAQQKALESSLVQFPKGSTERWERIANKVPGKTKEQCIQRFKTLAEMVKKKKLEGES